MARQDPSRGHGKILPIKEDDAPYRRDHSPRVGRSLRGLRSLGPIAGGASPAVVARPLVFLVVIAGGLGRVANQLPAGPYNEPLGRAPPRAKGLQHVLSDAGVTKSDEERCIVGADIRLTA